MASVSSAPVKAIEVKLSQGAKPGLGGVLPGAKVTPAIAAARGVPVGVTVRSPDRHPEFDDVAGLVDFVERLATASGLPVGIKSAVGARSFWVELAWHMASTGRGPDFIAVDGGEGGTGAGPLTFTDHVALPFQAGFAEVYQTFVAAGLHRDVVFTGSGKLGFAPEAMMAMVMGVDLVNVGREAMMAVGCIQAQRCHTGHCPTGVATQSRWLARGLDPADKSVRLANYVTRPADRAVPAGPGHGLGPPRPGRPERGGGQGPRRPSGPAAQGRGLRARGLGRPPPPSGRSARRRVAQPGRSARAPGSPNGLFELRRQTRTRRCRRLRPPAGRAVRGSARSGRPSKPRSRPAGLGVPATGR